MFIKRNQIELHVSAMWKMQTKMCWVNSSSTIVETTTEIMFGYNNLITIHSRLVNVYAVCVWVCVHNNMTQKASKALYSEYTAVIWPEPEK